MFFAVDFIWWKKYFSSGNSETVTVIVLRYVHNNKKRATPMSDPLLNPTTYPSLTEKKQILHLKSTGMTYQQIA